MSADRERWALSGAAGGLTAALAYVAQRLWERSLGSPQDPLLVLYDAHVAFYSRALAATWWGGVGLVVALAVLRGAAARARLTRLIEHGAIPLVLIAALAAYLWP